MFSFACEERDNHATACGVSDPIADLSWLKQLAEESGKSSMMEYSYIMQAKYKGERVFFWGSCSPNGLWALVLRDCSGNEIEGEYKSDALEEQQVLWQLENSQCGF